MQLAYLGALVKVARADGELVELERLWLRHVAKARFGAAPNDDVLFSSDVLWDEACAPRPSGGRARALLDDAVVLALIDGPLCAAEIRAVEEVGRAVGVGSVELRALLSRHR